MAFIFENKETDLVQGDEGCATNSMLFQEVNTSGSSVYGIHHHEV